MVVKKYLKASIKCILLFLIAILLVSCNQKHKEQTRSIDGMVQSYIPEGSFMMGSTDEQIDWMLAQSWCVDCERIWFEHEQPAHTVSLDAFWMDKYEVSNGQYKKCVDANACNPPEKSSSSTQSSYYGNSQFDNYPVINVSWYDAVDYCSWAGGSLPTEAQWEYAARGDTGRIYSWGTKSPSCDLANVHNDATFSYCIGHTQPVDSYPDGTSAFGVFNMAGNVWEWVKDVYIPYSSGSQTNPTGPSDGGERVLRGGGWVNIWRDVRAAYRSYYNPDFSDSGIGFRCVSSEQP